MNNENETQKKSSLTVQALVDSSEPMSKILIIDDETGIRDLLSFGLRKKGYRVETSSNGTEGLEKFRQTKFDLVITDIKLPDISGMEVLDSIKKIESDAEVILLTGYASVETAAESVRKGAFDYIQKPCKLEDLFSLVQKASEKNALKKKLTQTLEKLKQANEELTGARDKLEEKVKGRTHELELSEAKYRKIIDNSFEPIIGLNSKTEIITWSKGAELTFGYKDSEIIGQSISVLTPPQKEEEEIKKIQELKETGFIKNWITQRITKDGKIIEVNITMSLLGEEGISVVLRDITREQEIDRMKTDFVSNVSHELRTPLTSIKGAVELILKRADGKIPPSQEEFLVIIKKNTTRLIKLISDLLDLSKIESGRIEMEMKSHDITTTIKEIVGTIKNLLDDKGISLNLNMPDEFPEVVFDDDRIKQVLVNLISNAVKFTPSGGNITITTEDKDNEIQVTVSDSGIGIAPENLDKVFEKFQQVDSSATRATGGTGLGLTITKSIVESHNGKIWIKSELGKGSSFIFCLPKRREKEIGKKMEQKVLVDSLPSNVIPKKSFTIKKILVIDDDVDLASVIKGHLEQEGYEVITANSGLDGVKKTLTEQPHLITLDILMPHMDGFTVAEILRQNPKTKNIPIVIVSVIPEKERGYRLGVADYITKPFEPKGLLESLKKIEGQINQEISKRKILIVDDEADTVSILTALLSEQGYTTLKAYDGIEALTIAKREKPDTIILDLMMPEMDGFAVIKKLKTDNDTNKIPIIVLTARDLKTDRIKALDLGATEYLTKPFSTDSLLTEITRVLESQEKL